ncbi:MAG: ABC transporter substrate binding protein, partial [Desulfobacteraceae bacterium]
KTIDTINADPDIGAFYLGALLLRNAAGKTYTAPDIIDYVVNHAQKPAIGPNYAFIKMGLFGGASVDFFAMGVQAGKKAASVLNGKDPGSLPIDDAREIALVFNLARAETLDIHIPNDILLSADEVYR